MTKRRVDVLICTFRRPEVTRTLVSLAGLEIPEDMELRVVVADNDDTPSAQARVAEATAALPYPVQYVHAPARNISIARNACLDTADTAADWVAFLDDDEYVASDWLMELVARAEATEADAVFGPVLADYGPETPEWIRAGDYHSSIPQRRGGRVETGITGNALLRWSGVPWQDERFDLSRGKSGGEDTEFFLRLNRAGAFLEICDTAIAREAVPPERLEFPWMRRRKYRMGQSYSAAAPTRFARGKLGLLALGKVGFCAGAAVLSLPNQNRRNFWVLRSVFHAGVCSGCLSLRQTELYGAESDPSV